MRMAAQGRLSGDSGESLAQPARPVLDELVQLSDELS
jgi:hypothetical protein